MSNQPKWVWIEDDHAMHGGYWVNQETLRRRDRPFEDRLDLDGTPGPARLAKMLNF